MGTRGCPCAMRSLNRQQTKMFVCNSCSARRCSSHSCAEHTCVPIVSAQHIYITVYQRACYLCHMRQHAIFQATNSVRPRKMFPLCSPGLRPRPILHGIESSRVPTHICIKFWPRISGHYVPQSGPPAHMMYLMPGEVRPMMPHSPS